MKRIRLASKKIYFEPHDIWIGVYWKYDKESCGLSHLHFFVCLIPMVPLYFMFQIGTYLYCDRDWLEKTGKIDDR